MRTAASLLALGFVLSLAHVAHADEPPSRVACTSAYEQGQRLRRAKKLLDAREKLVMCARNPCPTVFQPECARWLAEVEAALPTIVVAIEDPARPPSDARAFVDDVPLGDSVDGIARPVDPGEHVLRVTWGDNVVTRKITVIEGAKAQRMVVAPERPVVLPTQTTPATPPAVGVPDSTTKVPFATFALGGLAVAGAGVFTYFWFTGVEDGRELARTCSPFCTEEQVDPARTKILVADIALGAAIAAAAGAVLVWVLTPSTPQAKDALSRPLVLRF